MVVDSAVECACCSEPPDSCTNERGNKFLAKYLTHYNATNNEGAAVLGFVGEFLVNPERYPFDFAEID